MHLLDLNYICFNCIYENIRHDSDYYPFFLSYCNMAQSAFKRINKCVNVGIVLCLFSFFFSTNVSLLVFSNVFFSLFSTVVLMLVFSYVFFFSLPNFAKRVPEVRRLHFNCVPILNKLQAPYENNLLC